MRHYNKVLLIDDNPIDNLVNEQLIKHYGFATSVVVADSAAAAIKLLTESKDLPDLIFLDIIMPGMDGFGFLSEFEKLPEEVRGSCKIIMLSSSESFKDLNRANSNRFVYKFLNKPLSQPVLAAINV